MASRDTSNGVAIAITAVALTIGSSQSQRPAADSGEGTTQLSTTSFPESSQHRVFEPAPMEPHAYFALNGTFPAPDPMRPFQTTYIAKYEMAEMAARHPEIVTSEPDRGDGEKAPALTKAGEPKQPSSSEYFAEFLRGMVKPADPQQPLRADYLPKALDELVVPGEPSKLEKK